MIGFIQSVDENILDFIQNSLRSGLLDAIMPYISILGNAGLIWIATALILIITKEYRSCGITMLIAIILGALVCNVILKPLVARPRPFEQNPVAELLIKPPDDYSFPSGHTVSSFAASVVILLKLRRVSFAVPAFLIAAGIAFSRLYLYVHYPSDVFCGMIIGIAAGAGAVWIFDKIKPRLKI